MSVSDSLNAVQIFFLVCAGIGGVLFAIKLALQFMGSDGDLDAHGDIGLDHGDAGHLDADASFKILTIQGLMSFLLMFGLVGFALQKDSGAGILLSILGAVMAGFASVWAMGKLFRTAKKLQSSGTLEVVSATGCEGTVYLTIPKNGTGRVFVSVKGRLREFDAVSHNHEEIKTDERIRVVWVNGSTLVVEKI